MKILTAPNPILRKKAKAFREVTPETRALIEEMFATLRDDPLGIGLAAPQVGVSEQLIVIDAEGNGCLTALLNPRIIAHRGSQRKKEGCLSVPGFYANVDRWAWIRVKALNKDGKPFEIEGEDLLARLLQHEIDHLHGVLFIDRVQDWEEVEFAESCTLSLDRAKELSRCERARSL